MLNYIIIHFAGIGKKRPQSILVMIPDQMTYSPCSLYIPDGRAPWYTATVVNTLFSATITRIGAPPGAYPVRQRALAHCWGNVARCCPNSEPTTLGGPPRRPDTKWPRADEMNPWPGRGPSAGLIDSPRGGRGAKSTSRPPPPPYNHGRSMPGLQGSGTRLWSSWSSVPLVS